MAGETKESIVTDILVVEDKTRDIDQKKLLAGLSALKLNFHQKKWLKVIMNDIPENVGDLILDIFIEESNRVDIDYGRFILSECCEQYKRKSLTCDSCKHLEGARCIIYDTEIPDEWLTKKNDCKEYEFAGFVWKSRVIDSANMNINNVKKERCTGVVHWKKESYDVYIGRGGNGRPYHSKWHNPFSIGKDGTRKEVIEKYKQYILSNPRLMDCLLEELDGKILGCWCKPKACHGDVLVELIKQKKEAS